MPLPLLAGQLVLLQLILGVAELGQGLVDPWILGPGLEQLVQPLLKRLVSPSQARQPGARGEEQLAQPPLPGADLFARSGKPFVIDAEERLECVLVDAAEETIQLLVGDRRGIIGTTERVQPTFSSEDLQLIAGAMAQLTPDAKLIDGMDEVVGRQVREVEQQVR